MKEIDVHVVQLAPMRVATAYGFGSSPEAIAWDKINAYIKQANLLKDGQPLRFFGFNNPSPTPGSPNYGYEQWVIVGSQAKPEADIKIKEFEGGLYAVARTNLAEISQNWQNLVAWRERGAYHSANHQWLEEVLTWKPDITPDDIGMENVMVDLYLPIAK